MIKVCDVPDITYYAIHVIPESRLYTFKKQYKLQPMGNCYPSLLSQSGSNDFRFKVFDDMIKDMQTISNSVGMLSHLVSTLAANAFTFNMSIFKNGCSYSMFTSEFISWATLIDLPVFTSADKAKEFLVDELRILHMSNTYLEYDATTSVRLPRIPAELEIVSLTQDEVSDLSRSHTVVVNPYLPAFF